MDIADSKRRLRADAKSARAAACAAQANAPMHLAARFLAEVPLRPESMVGGYWPVGDEMDVRPLLQALHGEGMALALPAVVAPATPLAFHAWRPEDELAPGAHGIPAPLADAPLVIPDLMIVPLLAFDRQGWRLGYGAGYYDRTLEAFAAAGRAVTAVGVAYAAQELSEVPHDGGDCRLDAVVTDKATYWFTDSGKR
ncbi:MAG TPA: 5-formyltetrahydrofolate cyclo-ligase [Alphaproteobacteria bacterium]|jgi:5-formyltetrahydrofolate cyclo-ligase